MADMLINKADKHTAIIEKGEKEPIEQVIMSNGTDTFYAGNTSADVFETLKISSELASSAILDGKMQTCAVDFWAELPAEAASS